MFSLGMGAQTPQRLLRRMPEALISVPRETRVLVRETRQGRVRDDEHTIRVDGSEVRGSSRMWFIGNQSESVAMEEQKETCNRFL